MASGYEGTVADFTNAHNRVDTVNQQIEGDLKSLYGQLTELESAWRGMAKTSFDQLMVRFQDDAKKLNQALEGISQQLMSAGSTYQQQEDEQQSSFTNITGTLG